MGILTQYSTDIGGIDDTLITKIGNSSLTTTAQDLSGAINEHESDIISIINNKADKSTTLAGYGITDAKISNGTITLGSNTITPLTSHQDISGKVNKSGDTMSGNLAISMGSTAGAKVTVSNSTYTVGLHIGSGGVNHGIYDFSSGIDKWLLYHNGTDIYAGSINVTTAAKALSSIGAAASSHTHNYAGSSSAGGVATTADKLNGFSSRSTSMTWGVQTGTTITCFATSNSGGWGFRDNCPSSGQVSCVIDGRFYQNEGNYMCLDTQNYSSYALPKSGGTMSGIITHGGSAGSDYKCSNLIFSSGTNDWSNSSINFYDKNGNRTGYLNWRKIADTELWVYLSAQRSNSYCGIQMGYRATGTISTCLYGVSDAAQFRSAIGAAASSSILTKTNIEDISDAEAKKY